MKTLLWFFLVMTGIPGVAAGEGKWYVLGYVGQYSPRNYVDFLFDDWKLQDEYLAALGVGREVARCEKLLGFDVDIGLEVEGLAVSHWGDSRSYQEYVGALNVRWHDFPWNHILPTTVGTGAGLSYATRVPDHEAVSHRGSANLLVYLMYEITLGLPQWPQQSIFFRVHHRSGAFGAFDGVHGASNYPCLGFRHIF